MLINTLVGMETDEFKIVDVRQQANEIVLLEILRKTPIIPDGKPSERFHLPITNVCIHDIFSYHKEDWKTLAEVIFEMYKKEGKLR